MAPLLTEECSACCLTFTPFFSHRQTREKNRDNCILKKTRTRCQLHDKTSSAEETLPAFQLLLFDQPAEITHHKSPAAWDDMLCYVRAMSWLCAQSVSGCKTRTAVFMLKICFVGILQKTSKYLASANLPRRMEQFLSLWIYLTYPAGIEHTEGLCKGEAKLRTWLDKPSVCHIQADQLNYLLPVLPGSYSSGL